MFSTMAHFTTTSSTRLECILYNLWIGQNKLHSPTINRYRWERAAMLFRRHSGLIMRFSLKQLGQ